MNMATDVNWAGLTTEILTLLKSETKDLWKKEDEAYLQSLAETLVTEKSLATMALDEKTRIEHEQNILHLAAQVRGEIAIRGLQLQDKATDVFVRVVGAIIRTLVVAVVTSATKTA